jgi:hypothetical protein
METRTETREGELVTREQIIVALAEIERALADTVTITHHIIDPDGREVGRISKTVRLPREEKS